ncbi:MAG: hypothetical protein ACE5IL_13380 [Myxococcota bacterium]
MANRSSAALLGASAILAVAVVAAAWLVKSSVDAATDEISQVRAAVAGASAALRTAGARAAAPARRAAGPDPSRRYKVNVADAPVRGPLTAKVEIVEFSDFQ